MMKLFVAFLLFHAFVVVAVEKNSKNTTDEKAPSHSASASSKKGLNCDASIKPWINPQCYPQAKRGNVVDDYNGTKVADPYRALEDPDSNITVEFVKQLNALSGSFLDACTVRKQIKEQYEKTFNSEMFSNTQKEGKFYYYTFNSGSENQAVYYQQKSLKDKGTVFLDPNTFSENGTTVVQRSLFTVDGTIMAYGISEEGSDWMTLKFKNVNGSEIADVIPNVDVNSNLAWLADNSGLFYSTYQDKEKFQFHSLFFHRIGTNAKDDILVLERKDEPDMHIDVQRCRPDIPQICRQDDSRFLFISQQDGFGSNTLYYYDLSAVGNKITGKIQPIPLVKQMHTTNWVVASDDHSALILTNHGATTRERDWMFKLVRAKLNGSVDPRSWEVVIPDGGPKRKMEWAMPIDGDKLVVWYTEDVKSALYVHDLQSGKQLYQIQIPLNIGKVTEIWARQSSSELFVAFVSHLVPATVYHGDFAKLPTKDARLQLREIRRANVPGLEPEQFVVKQVFYPSGRTKIPMFIVHGKDMPLDDTRPALLFADGGFHTMMLPYFSARDLLFVKHFGGVWAIANVRGGSEYGLKWHEAAILGNRQKQFDDFIGAAEYLIHKKYTKNTKLAIGSNYNGGLLVAVASQQRPDLFGAAFMEEGIFDMLRFNKITDDPNWMADYGNPDDPVQFPFIFKYSPPHQLSLKRGQQWPSTLLTAIEHEDRVPPMHTLKYTAQLYHFLATRARDWYYKPVLARIIPKDEQWGIDELTAEYCFLQRVLELTWKEG